MHWKQHGQPLVLRPTRAKQGPRRRPESCLPQPVRPEKQGLSETTPPLPLKPGLLGCWGNGGGAGAQRLGLMEHLPCAWWSPGLVQGVGFWVRAPLPAPRSVEAADDAGFMCARLGVGWRTASAPWLWCRVFHPGVDGRLGLWGLLACWRKHVEGRSRQGKQSTGRGDRRGSCAPHSFLQHLSVPLQQGPPPACSAVLADARGQHLLPPLDSLPRALWPGPSSASDTCCDIVHAAVPQRGLSGCCSESMDDE